MGTWPTSAGPLGRAAQHGLDPGQQLLDAERLDHVIVGPVAQAAHPVGLFAPGGEDDHRQGRAQAADLAEDLQPVAPGQHQVQQQQVELGARRHFQALVAVGRLQRLVAGEPQGIDDPPADGRVVFDGQDPGFATCSRSSL